VSLTAPTASSTVAGSSVTLTATSSDNVGVTGVQFQVDGANVGSSGTSSPYSVTWNSTGVADGSHTIAAVAHDASNNYATSSISVAVDNTPPVISAISSGTPGASTSTITWTTDEAATSQVVYGLTTGYGSATSTAGLATSHSLTLTGLAATTTYHYAIVSADGQGNTSTSTDQTFSTAPPSWVLSGASIDMDFANGNYYGGSTSTLLSVTRAQTVTSYAQTSAGTLTAFAANTARITDQGLLIEEARTNITPQSQFASGWSTNVATLTSNATTAPDGTATASKLAYSSTGNVLHYINESGTLTNATAYTVSLYAKAGEYQYVWVDCFDGTTDFGVLYDVSGGTVVGNRSGGGSITSSSITALANGWYRISFKFTSGNTGGSFAFQTGVQSTNVLTFGNPGSGTIGNGVYVWGYQHEAGAFATSYIPTTASSVTRAADNIQATGAFLAATANMQTSVVAKTTNLPPPYGASRIYGANSNGAMLTTNNSTSIAQYDGSFVTSATLGSGTLAGSVKSGFSMDGVNTSIVANNGTVVTAADSFVHTQGYLGSQSPGNSNFLNGIVARFTAWTSRLPDATLKALTQ